MTIRIAIMRLPHGEGLPLPAYATPGAAGMDVVAAEDLDLAPGQRHAVATGYKVAIPEGYEIQVRPRSGLAFKHGISVPNTPGTIDSDYRGELKILLINHGSEPFAIRRGERIAQLVPAAVTLAEFDEVDELCETARGTGGFGSTGTNSPFVSSEVQTRMADVPRLRSGRTEVEWP
jgi:dUTP pyrophosphatase